MKIGIVGLGRMGMAIAHRLLQAGHEVLGYDPDAKARASLQTQGGTAFEALDELGDNTSIIWVMVPADVVDTVIADLDKVIKPGAIIIDGGNSKFSDSVRRVNMLKKRDVAFLDCGTSGGLKGREIGFSLMVGGNRKAYEAVEPLFKAIAASASYALVGPSGAGHYTKMVHNGVEYALLQAYAEGFHLLKKGEYPLDLHQVAGVWKDASIIRSFILDLAYDVFAKDQEFKKVRGEVQEGGTGVWTVQEADKKKIPVPLIKEAVHVRSSSRKTGGTYATKIVAMLRKQFGGHTVKTLD